MRVLITGGSGYLGQFLIRNLSTNGYEVAYLYHSNPLPQDTPAEAFQADLTSGQGLQQVVSSFAPHVVVNCAAMSQPMACEKDYEACRALNVPSKLIAVLQQQQGSGVEVLVVHISTDQVYEGSRAWWTENCPTKPINAYGRSKLAAERYLQEAWPGRHICMRSSLIYGPEPPYAPVGRPLFVQFVEQVLAQGKETSFFIDEYRCSVYVDNICDIVQHIISRYQAATPRARSDSSDQQGTAVGAADSMSSCKLAQLPHCIYNLGGPERLSRHDMAMAVAQHCEHSSAAVKAARSADVQRGYHSPSDISMKMDRLLKAMPGTKLTPFAQALGSIFP